MKDQPYYDKYWSGDVAGGVLNEPPIWTADNLAWHIGFFKPYCGARVLDIGAGDGTFLHALSTRCERIQHAEALELSEVAIRRGAEKYPSLLFKQGSCDALPYDDNTFDSVCAIEVLEHVLDSDRCLSEVWRILKPGGFFFVTTTDFNLPKKWIIATFFWDRFFYPNNPHIRFFTRKTLSTLAQTHGFSPTVYRWNHSYCGLMPKGQMAVFEKTSR